MEEFEELERIVFRAKQEGLQPKALKQLYIEAAALVNLTEDDLDERELPAGVEVQFDDKEESPEVSKKGDKKSKEPEKKDDMETIEAEILYEPEGKISKKSDLDIIKEKSVKPLSEKDIGVTDVDTKDLLDAEKPKLPK